MANSESCYTYWQREAQLVLMDIKMMQMKMRNWPHEDLAKQLSELYDDYFANNAMKLYALKEGKV